MPGSADAIRAAPETFKMQDTVKTEKIRTYSNLLTGIITMVIQFGVGFFLSSFIVKNLGEAANGFTQLANNFVSYASLVSLAFNSMAGRFIAVSVHRGDRRQADIYFSSVIVCNLALSALLIPAAVLVTGNLDKLIEIGNSSTLDVKILFGCVFVNYFFSQISSIFSISFYVVNKVYVQNIIILLRHAANASLLLLVFGIFPPRIFYVSMIACFLTFLGVPVYAFFLRKNMPYLGFGFSKFRFATVLELGRSGIWNTVNQCGNLLMTEFDLLLSNLYVSPDAMGWLAVSKTVPSAFLHLTYAINNSFAPDLTKEWAQQGTSNLLTKLRRNMKISTLIMSVPVVTFCVFSVDFYRLWMPTLDPVMLAKLTFLACFSMIPWAGPQILYNVLTTTNKLSANAITFLVTGFLNFGIVALLLNVTDLGVYAIAGVSSVLSLLRNLVFTAPYTAKILNLRWYTLYYDVAFSLLCSAVNAAVGLCVRYFFSVGGWFTLFLFAGITAVVSLVLESFIAFGFKGLKTVCGEIFHRH